MNGQGQLCAGTFIDAPTKCVGCTHRTCATFPEVVGPGAVEHRACPEGFSTFSCRVGDHHVRVVGVLDLELNEDATSEFKKRHRSQKVRPQSVRSWCNNLTAVRGSLEEVVDYQSQELLNSLHEVKTACSAIIRNAEDLVADSPGGNFDERLRNSSDPIRAVYGSAELLIQQLQMSSLAINPAAAKSSAPHPIPVYKIFHKYNRILQAVATKKGVTVYQAGHSDGRTVAYDSFTLLPLILIQNAIKYTPRNGGHSVKIYVDDIADQIRCRVTNVGPEISETDREKIFEKGHRTDNVAGELPGYGIGLYVARIVADAHDTSITVRSERHSSDLFLNTFQVQFRLVP